MPRRLFILTISDLLIICNSKKDVAFAKFYHDVNFYTKIDT